jgi:hypothetical protein
LYLRGQPSPQDKEQEMITKQFDTQDQALKFAAKFNLAADILLYLVTTERTNMTGSIGTPQVSTKWEVVVN